MNILNTNQAAARLGISRRRVVPFKDLAMVDQLNRMIAGRYPPWLPAGGTVTAAPAAARVLEADEFSPKYNTHCAQPAQGAKACRSRITIHRSTA